MGSFNVMKHGLVPEHRVVPQDREEEILEDIDLSRDKLPKILKSDPVLQHLEKVHGDIEEGRIIEVNRESETAGVAKVYRLVIEK